MKTKALISCVVTVQQICVFVFACAKAGFSHDVAYFIDSDFAANNISSEDDSDDDYNDDDDDSDFDGGGKKRKKNMTSTQKPVAAKVINKDNKKTPAPKAAKAASNKGKILPLRDKISNFVFAPKEHLASLISFHCPC